VAYGPGGNLPRRGGRQGRRPFLLGLRIEVQRALGREGLVAYNEGGGGAC
jgi:hypothetical protein